MSWHICSDYNSKMMTKFKILLFALSVHIVHSNYEDLEIDSTTSHESCVEPDEATSESNCFCYNEPEKDLEYSICAPAIDTPTTTTTSATPFICPVKGIEAYPRDNYRLVQGKCFYFERKYMNWEGARDNCKQMGGKLYEPKNVSEMKQVSSIAIKVSQYGYTTAWLGITDTASEGNFVYDSNGQSITFNPPWQDRGQTKGTSNNCVGILTGAEHICPYNCYNMGKMFDLPCSFKTGRSICEL